MKQYKAQIILASLNKAELKSFRHYIEHPILNKKNQQIIDLFDYMVKYHPSYPEKNINKDSIFKHLSKKTKSINPQKVNRLMSDLGIILESFLTILSLKRESFKGDMLLVQELKQRNLDKSSWQLLQKMKKDFDGKKARDLDYYTNFHEIHKSILNHPQSESLDPSALGFIEGLNVLDEYFVLAKLRFLCDVSSKRKVVNIDNEIWLEQEIFDRVKEKGSDNNPVAQIYSDLYKALGDPTIESYSLAKENFLKLKDRIGKKEQSEMFLQLSNVCLLICFKDVEFRKELLELYKTGLKEEFMFLKNELPDTYYLNIVNLACALKEFDWAENFIEEYRAKLNRSKRKNTYLFNKAFLSFKRKEFEKCLDLIQELKSDNIYYMVIIRCIKLMSFYELKGYDSTLMHFLDSHTQFLRRSKSLSDLLHKRNLLLVTFVRKLQRLRLSGNQESIERLEEEVIESDSVYKSWLIDKIAELKK